jgi:hypothetical protein
MEHNEPHPMMGTCYDDCCKLVLYRNFPEDANHKSILLCHGLVTGNAGIVEGRKYTHAWIEYTSFETGQQMVYDATTDTTNTREWYYQCGKVRLLAAYCYDAAVREATESGTHGPWNSYIQDYDQKHNSDLIKHYQQQTRDTPDAD